MKLRGYPIRELFVCVMTRPRDVELRVCWLECLFVAGLLIARMLSQSRPHSVRSKPRATTRSLLYTLISSTQSRTQRRCQHMYTLPLIHPQDQTFLHLDIALKTCMILILLQGILPVDSSQRHPQGSNLTYYSLHRL